MINNILYYLLLSVYLRSGTRQKPALSSATQHAMLRKIRRKVGYPAVCGIQREADLFINIL